MIWSEQAVIKNKQYYSLKVLFGTFNGFGQVWPFDILYMNMENTCIVIITINAIPCSPAHLPLIEALRNTLLKKLREH